MYVALWWGTCGLGESQPSQSNLCFTFLFIFSFSAANCVSFLSSTASTSLDMRKKKKKFSQKTEKCVKYKLVHSTQRRMVTIVV